MISITVSTVDAVAPGVAIPAGPIGASAYDLAVMLGYGGTLDQWIAQLKGRPGDPGTPGRGIADASFVGGHLVLTLTDGARVDVGAVAGAGGTLDLVEVTDRDGTVKPLGTVLGALETGLADLLQKANEDFDALSARIDGLVPAPFPTRALAMAAAPLAATKAISIDGWKVPGDGGGGFFVRMDGSAPMLKPPTAPAARLWHFQTADGAWWLRWTRGPVSFEMFGALGGFADASDAIQAALDYHATVFAADGAFPRVEMQPGFHTVSRPLTCPYASPYVCAPGGDNVVSIRRVGVWSGPTIEFGTQAQGCQRLVCEGMQFDVPVDGHWIDGLGRPQAAYTDGAVIVGMRELATTGLCLVTLDRAHEIISGDRVYLYQTGAAAYERRAFQANVISSTQLLLNRLDGYGLYCRQAFAVAGDGSTRQYPVTHGCGTNAVNTALVDGAGNAVPASVATVAVVSPNVVQVNFATPPASGAGYTLTVSLTPVVGGVAGDPSGPRCSRVVTDAIPAVPIVGVSRANPCVVTLAADHANPFIVGDLVTFSGLTGMTELNGINCAVSAVGAHTITLRTLPTTASLDSSGYGAYAGGGAVAGVARGVPSYATAGLDNLIPGASSHIRAWYPVRGRLERIQAFRTRAPIEVIGDSYMRYDRVTVGGIYCVDRPGLQETLAGLNLPFQAGAFRTLPTINEPGLVSSGFRSPPRVVRRGNAGIIQQIDGCGRDGIYCEQSEGFDYRGGYLGGHARSVIRFKPLGVMVHLKIMGSFSDGAGGYAVHVEVGSQSIWNFIVAQIDANGGDVCDGLLCVEDATGILPVPLVNGLVVASCVGQGYRMAPLALLGVDTAEITANIMTGYNQVGDTGGDPTCSAGVYAGPNARAINVLGGTYGGGVNTRDQANGCRWAVYSAAPAGEVTRTGVRAGRLGQAGGGLANDAVTTA